MQQWLLDHSSTPNGPRDLSDQSANAAHSASVALDPLHDATVTCTASQVTSPLNSPFKSSTTSLSLVQETITGIQEGTPKKRKGPYQSGLLAIHKTFSERACLVGTETAAAEFKGRVHPRTLNGWIQSIKIGRPLPPEGRQRHQGAGRKGVFLHTSRERVHQQALKLRSIASVTFCQLRALVSCRFI